MGMHFFNYVNPCQSGVLIFIHSLVIPFKQVIQGESNCLINKKSCIVLDMFKELLHGMLVQNLCALSIKLEILIVVFFGVFRFFYQIMYCKN